MKKLVLLSVIIGSTAAAHVEKIAVFIIIDGLSKKILSLAAPHCQYGIQSIIEHSKSYDQAEFRYAGTSTGPGHATIATGVWPAIHGIVDNAWYNERGEKITCVYDPEEPTHHRSSCNVRVDSISDQLLMEPHSQCFAVSSKDRGALLLAGSKGTPFWIDKQKAAFISLVAPMPIWIASINDFLRTQSHEPWQLIYPRNHSAYAQTIDRYDLSPHQSYIGKTSKEVDNDFLLFPYSNDAVIQCAEKIITNEIKPDTKKLLLWLSLSSLDKIGHDFSHDSIEYRDSLYHIDKKLSSLFTLLTQQYPDAEKLIIFTADHGNADYPEVAHKKYPRAKRLDAQALKEQLNRELFKKFGVENFVMKLDIPSAFINNRLLDERSPQDKQKILAHLTQALQSITGIQRVWIGSEIPFLNGRDRLTTYIQNSYFAGRSSPIQYVTTPYSLMYKHSTGCAHASPYNYTTQVPLFIHHVGRHKKERCMKKICMTQLAPTLAQFFACQKPSACSSNPLI